MLQFRGKGKLLLTGEYAVLDGARALAIPTRFGQQLRVEEGKSDTFAWRSLDHEGASWLRVNFSRDSLAAFAIKTGKQKEAHHLSKLLLTVERRWPGTTEEVWGKKVTTTLEFPRDWGLGSSSTLVYCLALWLRIDPYELLAATFGGSGYDLACAAADGPLVYRLKKGVPQQQSVDWSPGWLKHTLFVYRNQKQNSREGIKQYRKQKISAEQIDAISKLTKKFVNAGNYTKARELLYEHEQRTA